MGKYDGQITLPAFEKGGPIPQQELDEFLTPMSEQNQVFIR